MRRSTALFAALSALALVVVAVAVAFAIAQPGAQAQSGRRLVLEISDSNARPTKSLEAFDTVQFTVFDFDGDGVQEILAKNDNNWIYVFDARTGATLFETRDGVYDGWQYRELGGVAVGDVNGNDRWDLVSASSAGFVTVWELDPAKSAPGKLHFEKLWSKHVSPELVDPKFDETHPWAANDSGGFDSAPYLADVDSDGKDEIFVQADGLAGHYAFEGDGKLLWGKNFDDGNANPWVADLDRDGKLEVIYGTDAGRVWVYDAKTGDYKWQFDARKHGASPGSISLAPGLIDLDGDGRLEVVFGTRMAVENKTDPEWHLKQHTMVFALSSKGQLLWNKTFDWGEPHMYMWPAAHDVDGDGIDDAVMMDWNTVGHKPGNWETTGPPNLFAINGKGEVLFHTKVTTYWSNKNVVVADFDGDGDQDIVLNKGGVEDGIAWFDMKGEQLGIMDLPWSASRAPLLTDLYGDGRMHMLVPVATKRAEENYRELDVGYRHGKILVYDLDVPYDAAWDNVFVFNHALDHLYGGKGKVTTRPVVDVDVSVVESERGIAVRIASDDDDVERVTARPAGTDDDPIELRRDDADDDVWRGDLAATRYEVTVHLESGAFATRVLEAKRHGSPAPPAPTTGAPSPGQDDAPSTEETTGGDDLDAGSRDVPMGGIVGAVVAAGAAAAAARRCGRAR